MIQYIDELKRVVEENYELTILNVIKVKNVYKIIGVEGDFCLKKFEGRLSKLNFILDVFYHFKQKGFENILDVIETKNHKRYISCLNAYFYLSVWIESRELNYSNYYDIVMASHNIGKLHNYSEGFIPSEGSEVNCYWMKWFDVFEKKREDIENFRYIIKRKHRLSGFDRIYLDNIDENINLANEVIEKLYKFDYEGVMREHIKKSCVCHHDLANHNILMDINQTIYFIDFDYAILDTNLHDLGSFVMRCLKIGRWNLDKFKIIINSYKDVKSLSKKELSLMLSFILFPNDFWQLGLQYYVEGINWCEEKFLKRLTRCENDRLLRGEFIRDIIYKI